MPLVALPAGFTLVIDCAAWGTFHVLAGLLSRGLPAVLVQPAGRLYRTRAWERGGAFYRSVLRIHRWKSRLPECGEVFGRGFSKRRLRSRKPAYLAQFCMETSRGELCHWLSAAPAPLFFLWNHWAVGALMLVYAVIVNVPFIAVQRYNRARLGRVLSRAGGGEARGGAARILAYASRDCVEPLDPAAHLGGGWRH